MNIRVKGATEGIILALDAKWHSFLLDFFFLEFWKESVSDMKR